MKYISVNSVINAFKNNVSKTTDSFWGILAIRLSILGNRLLNLGHMEIPLRFPAFIFEVGNAGCLRWECFKEIIKRIKVTKVNIHSPTCLGWV